MSAEQRAELLSALPDGEVPDFMLTDGRFDMELKIWRDLSQELRKINALSKIDRYSFAMYCCHMADWVRATLDIRVKGATYKARNTITKDMQIKMNPMVTVRDRAETRLLTLAERFGLDPISRFKLVGVQAGLAGQGFLPFGDTPGKTPASRDDHNPEADAPTGILARNAGAPPRPN